MLDESPQTSMWLCRFREGEREALAAAFNHYRTRLRQMVQLRIDPRLAARVDPSDVLQEQIRQLVHTLAVVHEIGHEAGSSPARESGRGDGLSSDPSRPANCRSSETTAASVWPSMNCIA